MRITSTLRRILSEIESLAHRCKKAKAISQWKTGSSTSSSDESLKVHIMLVKDVRYLQLAEVCVFSFLHYHPKSHFTFYCDSNTINYTTQKFSDGIEAGQMTLRTVNEDQGLSWQEQKLEIIMSLSGTRDLMLDADLRWNAKLESYETPLFLVEEFAFRDKSPFREIVEKTKIGGKDASMKNLSVFSFGGHTLSDEDINLIKRTMQTYKDIVESEIVGSEDRISVGRVIEQFVLSVCSETWGKQVSFVKDTDKPFDGGLVESCYFGATGGTF